MSEDLPSKWVVGADDQVARWLYEQGAGWYQPGTFRHITLARGDTIIAAYAFYEFNGVNCNVSFAITDKASFRKILRVAFNYAFGQLNAHRLTFVISSANIRSIELVRRIGAEPEATLREAGKEREDVHIYALFRETCSFWRKLNGQERRIGTGIS